MMSESAPTTAWIGSALRHIRSDATRDILDFRYAGAGNGNRWNELGDPTLYLACDIGVLIAEWGRHVVPRFPDQPDLDESLHQDVYSLKLKIDHVIDIRNADIARSVRITDIKRDALDMTLTRSAADVIRNRTRAQAMLVPSVAFLDDASRWNLVVFLEKMPFDTALWITDVNKIGPLRWK